MKVYETKIYWKKAGQLDRPTSVFTCLVITDNSEEVMDLAINLLKEYYPEEEIVISKSYFNLKTKQVAFCERLKK